MWQNGSFYWNELMTRDAEAAKKFYGSTLGWTFEAMESEDGSPPTYWVAKVGEEAVAGIFLIGHDDEETSEGWFSYVAIKDLSGALARASMEGGEVIREPWDVPGVGRIAIVNDNAGNSLGWMTPAEE
jgi:predicted enzyme related to lactoylglutathione lyase